MRWSTLLSGHAHRRAASAAGFALACGVALGVLPVAAETISGVCPDGSIFIVQRRSAVPCVEAKQVDPTDIPPLNPELLPRPYGWSQFQQRQNPNNPYNVVDAAPSVQRLEGPRADGPRDLQRGPEVDAHGLVAQALDGAQGPTGTGTPQRSFQTARAAVPSASATARRAERDIARLFTEQELRDLAQIVELSQRRAPATFAPRGSEPSDPAPGLTVRLAYSASFEPRLREIFGEWGGLPPGDVVLFRVDASEPQPFYGNLTFVQSGVVYHPNRDDVRELGVLRSELGMLGRGAMLLGYARFPEGMDVTREVDIYWNDRLLSAVLKPS